MLKRETGRKNGKEKQPENERKEIGNTDFMLTAQNISACDLGHEHIHVRGVYSAMLFLCNGYKGQYSGRS
jgi:hypothetical protein